MMIIENLYRFSTNDTYLVSKIIRSLSTRLKLAIINLKDIHESNKLILRRSSVKLPFYPLVFISILTSKFIIKPKIYE